MQKNSILYFSELRNIITDRSRYLETSQIIPRTRLFLMCYFALSMFPYQWDLCQVSFVGKKAGHSFARRIVLR